MSKAWYVATTKPNGDGLAVKELRKQGYVAYRAKTFDQQTDGKRVTPVGRLRLPGYIFVACNHGEHGPINHTRGVGMLLLDGKGDPEPLRPGIVEGLRALEDEEFDQARSNAEIKERTDLREWDRVIVDNPDHECYGVEGYFMEASKGIAKVLIGIGKWPVNIFDLKKVEKPKKDKKAKKSKGKRDLKKIEQPEKRAA